MTQKNEDKTAKAKVNKPDADEGKKPNFWGLVFIFTAIALISWMIAAAPREKFLNCALGAHSLTSFGTCTAE